MLDEYRFSPLENSLDGVRRASELLRRVFPHARHLEPSYLEWLYRDNPDGAARGFNAFHRGELVAHTPAQPITARVEGEELRGMLLLNTAVDPLHRRRGLTGRTSDLMFEDAAEQGFAFLVAVGNARSTLPLLTRFGLVGPLEARVGIGVPARCEWGGTAAYERVWRDDVLRWRLARPGGHYSVRTQGASTLVTAPSGKPGVSVILHDAPAGTRAPDPAGPSPGALRVWIGLDAAVDWKRSPFLPIPQRLRPSPLNLCFKDLSGRGLRLDPSRVVFRGLDFDAY